VIVDDLRSFVRHSMLHRAALHNVFRRISHNKNINKIKYLYNTLLRITFIDDTGRTAYPHAGVTPQHLTTIKAFEVRYRADMPGWRR
jgi:hypothetical protein